MWLSKTICEKIQKERQNRRNEQALQDRFFAVVGLLRFVGITFSVKGDISGHLNQHGQTVEGGKDFDGGDNDI